MPQARNVREEPGSRQGRRATADRAGLRRRTERDLREGQLRGVQEKAESREGGRAAAGGRGEGSRGSCRGVSGFHKSESGLQLSAQEAVLTQK